ncbi:unnamed protein product [Allacma fusca]|uniref:Uncharacterized protein n=1 Tax=Allacma fusca TaxID=39272 RepID=A0A8J2JMF1_9HEXA|nr:unnamed protein product [Allacma fusca]
MNIRHVFVAAFACCVAGSMPLGYVIMSVTHKRSVNGYFQLVCSHLQCDEAKCQLLSIYKDSNPFVRKDYATQEIILYPLPGLPFSLIQFKFLKSRVIVEGKIANHHASGMFTCEITTDAGTDFDWSEMSLYPCENCTFEAQKPEQKQIPKVSSESINRTVGSDFEVYCDHTSCHDSECVDLNILKDDKPFLRTEIGFENFNIYPLVRDPFGRIKLQKLENSTNVVVQLQNDSAGGKYSCEFVSLKGYFKDSRYLNVFATKDLRPLDNAVTCEVNEMPDREEGTAQASNTTSSYLKPTEKTTSSTVVTVVDNRGATPEGYYLLIFFLVYVEN